MIQPRWQAAAGRTAANNADAIKIVEDLIATRRPNAQKNAASAISAENPVIRLKRKIPARELIPKTAASLQMNRRKTRFLRSSKTPSCSDWASFFSLRA